MSSADLSPQLSLTKHHGLANDFLVAIEPSRSVTAADARRWCDRRTGVGADGFMVAHRRPNGGRSDWSMTLFNADGSPAEISGNGIRCLAQAIADHLGHDRARDLELDIESGGQVRRCTVLARSVDSDQDRVRVAMGKALDGPRASQRWGEAGLTVEEQVGVDIGNPHLVAFVADLENLDMARIGPIIEADYPQGCNVHVVRVLDGNQLVMKIWERGAGVTQACGSGASAAAWAAVRAGLISDGGHAISVEMPGGAAQVEFEGDDVVLIGPAVRIAGIEIA